MEVYFMAEWTCAEVDCMREFCFKGARVVSDKIYERFGVYHSPHACEAMASRCHISLKILKQCTQCGCFVPSLNRMTHLCPRCSELLHLEEERAFNELLLREVEEINSGGENLEAISRERVMLRKRNSRLCKKYGLCTKSERKAAKCCELL